MQTVITIEEDNHGLIGIAETFSDAIDFLISQDWLNEKCEMYDGDGNYKTIIEDLGVSWVDTILSWDWYKFNEYFEGLFYLNVEQVYKAE